MAYSTIQLLFLIAFCAFGVILAFKTNYIVLLEIRIINGFHKIIQLLFPGENLDNNEILKNINSETAIQDMKVHVFFLRIVGIAFLLGGMSLICQKVW